MRVERGELRARMCARGEKVAAGRTGRAEFFVVKNVLFRNPPADGPARFPACDHGAIQSSIYSAWSPIRLTPRTSCGLRGVGVERFTSSWVPKSDPVPPMRDAVKTSPVFF